MGETMSESAISAVRAAEDDRWVALLAQDYDRVQDHLHDALTYTHSNALFETKSDLLGNLRSGAFLYKAVKRDNLAYAAHAGAVFVTGTARIEAAYKGTAMTVGMRFSNVWVPGNGDRWQMVLWHSVPLATT
jgi:hypothetical protein